MTNQKCRNSLFGILFLVWFFLGTICGVLLFRLTGVSGYWVRTYCSLLEKASAGCASVVWSWIRPLLVAAVLATVSWGERVLPWLIGWRGCLMAFSASACYLGGWDACPVVLRGLLLLPLFYGVCRFCRLNSSVWSHRTDLIV